MLTLVLVLVQSIWTMLAAVVLKVTSLTVHIAPLSPASTATHKMQERDAKVRRVDHSYTENIALCSSMFLEQYVPMATVHMEMFVWWEALISMKVEWRCASMTSGGQCVMMAGAVLMQL